MTAVQGLQHLHRVVRPSAQSVSGRFSTLQSSHSPFASRPRQPLVDLDSSDLPILDLSHQGLVQYVISRDWLSHVAQTSKIRACGGACQYFALLVGGRDSWAWVHRGLLRLTSADRRSGLFYVSAIASKTAPNMRVLYVFSCGRVCIISGRHPGNRRPG